MNFGNASLLAGGVLVGIPVLLHLLMRQKPKHLIFPALQFVQQRREVNRRVLRLRHLLLLALRCLLIASLAAALARPRVAQGYLANWMVIAVLTALVLALAIFSVAAAMQGKSRFLVGGAALAALVMLILIAQQLSLVLRQGSVTILGSRKDPVAAALIFDTSPRMQYTHQDRSRIQDSQEIARWLLRQFPPDSDLSVIDGGSTSAPLMIDRGMARRLVDKLRIRYTDTDAISLLKDGMRAIGGSNKARKELYLFTDLSSGAWPEGSDASLFEQIGQAPDLLIYLVDVGVERPKNRWLTTPSVPRQTLVANNEATVTATVQRIRSQDAFSVQLFLEDSDRDDLPIVIDGQAILPTARLRGSQEISSSSESSIPVSFSLRGLKAGIHHGFVKISGQDALPFDDKRYFTFRISQAVPVLLIHETGVATTLTREAIAPSERNGNLFEVTETSTRELPNVNFEKYRAIALLDPASLPDSAWKRLIDYVTNGGSCLVFLGHNATASGFNRNAVQDLLPGKLARQWVAAKPIYLAPRNYDHPIFQQFQEAVERTTIPWHEAPVYRHWTFAGLGDSSRIVAAFTNGLPAIIEARIGRGQVITMTTPTSEPVNSNDRRPWNRLLSSFGPWPTVILLGNLFHYSVSSADQPLNYLVGQPAQITFDGPEVEGRQQLFTPRQQWDQLAIEQGQATYRFTETPGTYRIKGGGRVGATTGFSVNTENAASNIQRAGRDRLDQLLGKDGYRLARSIREIDRGIDESRMGREFYPFLILLAAVILAMEFAVANRFYANAVARPSRTITDSRRISSTGSPSTVNA